MAWYTLKVMVGCEAVIRREIAQACIDRGLEIRVALPVVPWFKTSRHGHVHGLRLAISKKRLWSSSRPDWKRALESRKRLRSVHRMQKIAPGYLFVRLRLEHLEGALQAFEGIRGIGAVDSYAGLPRPVMEPQAEHLERGRFYLCDHRFVPAEEILT